MKNILSFLLLSILALTACKEKPITIPEPATPKRRVLVEELTGVRCTNCPDGARTLLSLQSTFGKDNLILVSNHSAGSFSFPYPDSKFKFNFPEGQAMSDFIGQPIGFPTAAIGRFQLNSGQSPFVSASLWAGLLNSEFAKDYGLGLFIKTAYNATTRQVKIEVLMDPTQTLVGEHRLSVIITQDSIVDSQLDNGTKLKEYVHRHVLRGVLSSPTGDLINEPITAGVLLQRKYTFTLPDDTWKPKNCSVVAFVHHGGTPDKEVLQVAEHHVVD